MRISQSCRKSDALSTLDTPPGFVHSVPVLATGDTAMLNQNQLYHAASALADAVADACKDGAIDLAIEQADALQALIRDNRYEEPQIVSRLFQEARA
jgi:hypothetical protein